MARQGIPYVIVPLVLGAAFLATPFWWLALATFALAAFMLFFFRDPERQCPAEAGVVVSPADGRVTRVRAIDPGSPESPVLVSIFLSPLDVHINRAPIAGTITDISYTKGKFLVATSEQSSLVNEQNALTIQAANATVVCKQIAGILARRILCWKRVGDHIDLGERFGLIKFSSRTDLILPPQVQVEVTEGMHVKGGTTIIGRIR